MQLKIGNSASAVQVVKYIVVFCPAPAPPVISAGTSSGTSQVLLLCPPGAMHSQATRKATSVKPLGRPTSSPLGPCSSSSTSTTS